MAHRGTRVILIAGNHDEMLRPYAGMSFGGAELALETIHCTADGRTLLVTQGAISIIDWAAETRAAEQDRAARARGNSGQAEKLAPEPVPA